MPCIIKERVKIAVEPQQSTAPILACILHQTAAVGAEACLEGTDSVIQLDSSPDKV
jgi:hypothetical protein